MLYPGHVVGDYVLSFMGKTASRLFRRLSGYVFLGQCPRNTYFPLGRFTTSPTCRRATYCFAMMR